MSLNAGALKKIQEWQFPHESIPSHKHPLFILRLKKLTLPATSQNMNISAKTPPKRKWLGATIVRKRLYNRE